jgi:hypothetical protein
MNADIPKEEVSRLKAQMFHLGLTLCATGIATWLLHAPPVLMFLMMSAGWMTSLILFFAPKRPAYWRVTASALTSVAILSAVYRFALSPFFG